MNPLGTLIAGAVYGYLAGNLPARRAALKQLQKLSGMAIDGLNKQGGNNVQATNAAVEQSEQQTD